MRVLEIQPQESASYDFDMTPYIKRDNDPVTAINAIEIINSATGLAGALTVVNSLFSGNVVQIQFTNGVDGEDYDIVIDFQTALNASLRPDFIMSCIEYNK